ncbi:MAG TPA: lipoyl(octanoyl) transferase LipB [Burkholderiaceae bacterium]|jgi:lipoyl(octanoyl) transferase|nr:lipoyl(octanoyl) transferase LipB [Burkholderiaceae bacterium]
MDVRWLSSPAPYRPIWEAMREFTEARTETTPDELWLVEHVPVYTLGQAGKPEHLLNPGGIEVVKCDRGGQVTYHGPGQVVAYCLLDLKRRGLFVKEYVERLEDVIIGTLADLGLEYGQRMAGAPGVYVPYDGQRGAYDPAGDQLAKIAALGIKLRNGRSYHGLALNVDMDLTPFGGINPCGYEGLPTVDLRSCGISCTVSEAGQRLVARLQDAFGP